MVAVSEELLSLDPSLNPIITRLYVAQDREAAALKYSQEAPVLSKLGYVPGSDRWEERQRKAGEAVTEGTLWVTFIAKSLKSVHTVCSFCGSELPA